MGHVNIFVVGSPLTKDMSLITGINQKLTAALQATGYNIHIKLITRQKHGQLTISGENFTYTPNNYVGSDTFTYQAIDTLGQNSETTTITIKTQNHKQFNEILNNKLNQNELLTKIPETPLKKIIQH